MALLLAQPLPPLPLPSQICPILLDLMTAMDRIHSLPPNYGPRDKIKVCVEWCEADRVAIGLEL